MLFFFQQLYAEPWQKDGKWYQTVFQCRVNLAEIKHKKPQTLSSLMKVELDPHAKKYWTNDTIEWLMEPRTKKPPLKALKGNMTLEYWVCPDTQCVLTGIMVKESDEKPEWRNWKRKK